MKLASVLTTLTAALIGSAAGAAEPVVVAQAVIPGALPPSEIRMIVRSTGLRPLGPPAAQGQTYVLRAVDRRAEMVRVVVDARSGEILSVAPVVERRGRTGPDGPTPPYRPGPRVYSPGTEDLQSPGGPPPPPPGAKPPRAATATPSSPPVPRPRPVTPESGTTSKPGETAKSPDAAPKPPEAAPKPEEAGPKPDEANKPKP